MAEYVADKLDAARHSIAGSNVSKAVCKASSREVLGPKRKHIDYLLSCTDADNVSIPSLAELLFERSRMSSWVIVSKSLVTFHNLMSSGNERFLQYLASRTTLWNLDSFLDKSGVLGYDMSNFIRRYSIYLTKKAHTYTESGFDFCRVRRGVDGLVRKQDTPKLLKSLPLIQQQLDSLLEVDVQSSELANSVINSAFVMLFKDLVKLFACYNDGMINLLEKYFEMNKKNCKEALDIYKKFLSRMDTVKNFLKVAEEYRLTELMTAHGENFPKDVGINPSDIPDLTKAPSSLIEALENHYQSLEKGKVPVTLTKRPNLEPITVPPLTTETLNNPVTLSIDKYKKQELIKEENERLNSFKQTKLEKEVVLTAAPPRQTPSARQDAWKTTFENTKENNTEQPSTNNNDLLALHDVFSAAKPAPTSNINFGQASFSPVTNTTPTQPSGSFITNQESPWSPAANQTGPSQDLFATNVNFQQQQPFVNTMTSPDILQPMNRQSPQTNNLQAETKGDLHSSYDKLANAIDNLNVAGIRPAPGTTGKGHQWTPAKPTVKTGGAHFQMGTASGPTVPPQPMTQPGMVRPVYNQPQLYGQPMMYGQPAMTRAPNQSSMFPQQPQMRNDPFGGPVPNNQALF